jgi:hypothetical protein
MSSVKKSFIWKCPPHKKALHINFIHPVKMLSTHKCPPYVYNFLMLDENSEFLA